MGKELSYQEKMELAEEAKRLLSPTSMFNKIVNSLVIEYHDKLMRSSLRSDEATEAHAGLKALNDIKTYLKIIENDAIMAKDKAEKQGTQHSA